MNCSFPKTIDGETFETRIEEVVEDYEHTDVVFADGSATAPSLAFTDDMDLGFYRVETNKIGLAAGGNKRASVSTTQAEFEVKTLLSPDVNEMSTFLSDSQMGVEYRFGSVANPGLEAVIPTTNDLASSGGLTYSGKLVDANEVVRHGVVTGDGIDGALDTSSLSATTFPSGMTSFSVGFWFYLRDTVDQTFLYLTNNPSGITNRIWIRIFSGNLTILLTALGSNYYSVKKTFSTNTWYHVAFAGDATSSKLYVDGVEDGANWTVNTGTLDDPFRVTTSIMNDLCLLHNCAGAGSDYTTGSMAHLCVSRSKWSASQVASLYSYTPNEGRLTVDRIAERVSGQGITISGDIQVSGSIDIADEGAVQNSGNDGLLVSEANSACYLQTGGFSNIQANTTENKYNSALHTISPATVLNTTVDTVFRVGDGVSGWTELLRIDESNITSALPLTLPGTGGTAISFYKEDLQSCDILQADESTEYYSTPANTSVYTTRLNDMCTQNITGYSAAAAASGHNPTILNTTVATTLLASGTVLYIPIIAIDNGVRVNGIAKVDVDIITIYPSVALGTFSGGTSGFDSFTFTYPNTN